jgi:hypothetical protein
VAGLGRKIFVAGDVLTAAQVQGFLQDQAIMVFASSGARGTGITSPSEGMFVYLQDSNTLTFYNGADWQNFVPSLDNSVINNGTVNTSTFNGGTAFNFILDAPEENFVSTATAAGGTVTVDAGISGITYSTGTATSNFIINLRANSTATLDSIVNVGDAIIELGRVDGTSSIPALDFHSGSIACNYDARISASGGTGVSGKANLNVNAEAFIVDGNLTSQKVIQGLQLKSTTERFYPE